MDWAQRFDGWHLVGRIAIDGQLIGSLMVDRVRREHLTSAHAAVTHDAEVEGRMRRCDSARRCR